MNKAKRKILGEEFQATFNLLASKAIEMNKVGEIEGFIAYEDMVEIRKQLVLHGPKILNRKELPESIKLSLKMAVELLDPNQTRIKQVGNIFGNISLSVPSILLLIKVSQPIIYPGLWAQVMIFFGWGTRIPVINLAAIGGLLITLFFALYRMVQSNTPQERTVQIIKLVENGINEYIKRGVKGDSDYKKVTTEDVLGWRPSFMDRKNPQADVYVDYMVLNVSDKYGLNITSEQKEEMSASSKAFISMDHCINELYEKDRKVQQDALIRTIETLSELKAPKKAMKEVERAVNIMES